MSENNRHLAAIMFTDIVGFTTLMNQDESHALQIVKKNNNIQSALIQKFGGIWHKEIGDGVLSSFDSSVKAVECAVAIQQAINTEQDFQLRIGIHLGDITFRNGDVFGDGVNVASRIVSMAPMGGICLSGSLENSIKGNNIIKTQFIGEYKLKNVPYPIKLYQIIANDVFNTKSKGRLTIQKLYFLLPLAIVAIFIVMYMKGPITQSQQKNVVRFTIELPDSIERLTDISLSNDGKTIVYGAYVYGSLGAQMFIRSIDSFESQYIQGGDYLDDPVFSQDSRKVAFGSKGTIKVYSMESGSISTFGKAVSMQLNGLSWFNDSLIYAPGLGDISISGNLMEISEKEPENKVVISPDVEKGEMDLFNPFYLPSFNKLLYHASYLTGYKIQILDFDNMSHTEIISGENPKLIASGHLLYKDGNNLMCFQFNPDNIDKKGIPVRLFSNIEVDLFDVSSNGTLIYVENQMKLRQPIMVDRQGNKRKISMPKIFWSGSPRISPDEKTIAFRSFETNSIWLYDIEKGTSQILMDNISNTPQWFPDGKKIAYRSGIGEAILAIDVQQPDQVDTLVSSTNNIYPVSFSSDGTKMFYEEIHSTDQKNIWLYNLKTSESTPFLNTKYDESMAYFSPDGKYVVYCSDESGSYEIYLRNFNKKNEKWLISIGGGTEPRWSRNGKEILYRKANRIMSVPITNRKDGEFDFGKAELVFAGPYPASSYNITNFDISSDGNTFLMLQPASSENIKIHIVVNWFEELKNLMEE